jgi:hypothetical protein
MNHICFAVENIEAEVAKLRTTDLRPGTRSWISIDGPQGVTIELSQWH